MISTAIRYTLLCFLSVGSLLGVGSPALTMRQAPRKEFPSAYKTALRLLSQDKPAEALAEIDRGLERSPADSSLHNLRGLALGSLGRLNDAEASFRNIIRLQPNAAIGYSNLAALFEEMGRSKEAVALFREALKREPTNSIFMMRIGAILAALAQYSEAALYLEKAWAALPGEGKIRPSQNSVSRRRFLGTSFLVAGTGTLSRVFEYSAGAAEASPSPQHPLDSLTASEIEKVVQALQQDKRVGDATRFVSVTRVEPSPQELADYREGAPFQRRALAILLDRTQEAGFEAEVDLADGSVVRLKRLATFMVLGGVLVLASTLLVTAYEERQRERAKSEVSAERS